MHLLLFFLLPDLLERLLKLPLFFRLQLCGRLLPLVPRKDGKFFTLMGHPVAAILTSLHFLFFILVIHHKVPIINVWLRIVNFLLGPRSIIQVWVVSIIIILLDRLLLLLIVVIAYLDPFFLLFSFLDVLHLNVHVRVSDFVFSHHHVPFMLLLLLHGSFFLPLLLLFAFLHLVHLHPFNFFLIELVGYPFVTFHIVIHVEEHGETNPVSDLLPRHSLKVQSEPTQRDCQDSRAPLQFQPFDRIHLLQALGALILIWEDELFRLHVVFDCHFQARVQHSRPKLILYRQRQV
mmetsp:Transcript_42854/g.41174  ORF Transcript_42854/g.41174 Transcript_42854/m.41174 type:complete len:291 (-) Transcript_42854:590-1462(-)